VQISLLIGSLMGLCLLGGVDAVPANSTPALGVKAQVEIRELLEAQVAAWNQGDIEGFMKGYWNSPDLSFTSGGELRRGWQNTLKRYKETYAGRELMGELSFSDLEIHLLPPSPDGTPVVAWVLGRWRLKRATDEPHGVFTLILQRFPDLPGNPKGHWRIVHDHTSASSPEAK
jgi:ketosteroid isomerase-like protein